jgi:hypothetical protein
VRRACAAKASSGSQRVYFLEFIVFKGINEIASLSMVLLRTKELASVAKNGEVCNCR